ncbi:MAG TPA: hypothetical protein PLA94_19940, partial [Myxococcota bacterium]|nr:hypothetical protein [Myxococcota bacterium]
GCATGGAGVAVGLLPLWWRRRVRRHAPSGGQGEGAATWPNHPMPGLYGLEGTKAHRGERGSAAGSRL